MKTILLKRVERLEKAVIPPEPWRITAEFADGHTEILTARQFREAKEKYIHDVHVIDRVVSGNLAELDDWLRTVSFMASHVFDGPYTPI